MTMATSRMVNRRYKNDRDGENLIRMMETGNGRSASEDVVETGNDATSAVAATSLVGGSLSPTTERPSSSGTSTRTTTRTTSTTTLPLTVRPSEYRFYTRCDHEPHLRRFTVVMPPDFPCSAWHWGGLAVRIAAVQHQRLPPRQEDQAMTRVVEDLSPFFLETTGYELQYYRESKTSSHRYWNLVLSLHADRVWQDDTSKGNTMARTTSNDSAPTTTTTPTQLSSSSSSSMWMAPANPKAPPLWEASKEAETVLVHVIRPWWLPSRRSTPRFGPTTLKGHRSIDVCTWGQVYCEVIPLLWHNYNRLWVITSGSFGLLTCLALYFGISEETTPLWCRQLLVFGCLLAPLIVFELQTNCRNSRGEVQESIANKVQELSAAMEGRCGYRMDYTVHHGWFTTSNLRIYRGCSTRQNKQRHHGYNDENDGNGGGDVMIVV